MGTQLSTRIGYVVNAYPVASETFLTNELRGVEACDVELSVLALSRRQDEIPPDGFDQVTAAATRPPRGLPLGWVQYAVAHLHCLMRRPRAYFDLCWNDAWRPGLRYLRECHSTGSLRRLKKRWRLWSLAPLIAEQARRSGIGHLHAHYAKDPLEVAVRASWLSGLTYSFAAHAKDLYTTPPERLRRRLAKAKYALTCHPHGYQTLRGLAREEDRDRVHLIPHGLDGRLFRPSRRRRRPELIVAAGRLTPKKGFQTLVAACSLLPSDVSFKCVILGEGRLRGALKRQIRAAGLEGRCKLLGHVPQEELAKWYQRARVVTLPARVLETGNRDGTPNVLMEAMACGAPVVTTSVGSIGELIEHEMEGLLVPPEDPVALAEALRRALTTDLSDLGRRGAQRMAGMDYRSAARQVSRLHRPLKKKTDRASHVPFHVPQVDTRRLARMARRRLGTKPRLQPQVERAIAQAVAPGLAANSWRTDLERMAERRLWDEVYKAGRAGDLQKLARTRNTGPGGAKKILDVGCGRGGLPVALMAQGIPVVSLDLRWRNCRVTRLRGQRYHLSMPAVSGRAETLPFRDQSFDVVSLLEVLEHVADPSRLLVEARRVCRPGGVCVVTVVNRWAHLDPHYRLWGINFLPRPMAEVILSLSGRAKRSWRDNQRLADMHYFTFGAFRTFARSAGFEVYDPSRPIEGMARWWHSASRRLSLGFNTLTLVLEPR